MLDEYHAGKFTFTPGADATDNHLGADAPGVYADETPYYVVLPEDFSEGEDVAGDGIQTSWIIPVAQMAGCGTGGYSHGGILTYYLEQFTVDASTRYLTLRAFS